MVLLFERNDITKMEVNAIVNATNETLLGGGGVDGAIHRAAGPELSKECRHLGGCQTGEAKITKGYNLPAKYVIHTVGPIYRDGKHNEKKLLSRCYESCLKLAVENNIKSIAFPLISAGAFGYPKDEAIDVAVKSIKKFFKNSYDKINDDQNYYDMVVIIVLYGTKSAEIGKKKFGAIDRFIDENYYIKTRKPKRDSKIKASNSSAKKARTSKSRSSYIAKSPKAASSEKAQKINSLDEQIKNLDLSFSDSLLKIIDNKKLKDSDVYFKANMDRKLFSKIRNGSHPKKITAISLCIALKLSYRETNNLLIKAGYILNNSEKFDVIISYYIKNKIYDIYKINETLLYYDQQQLGMG